MQIEVLQAEFRDIEGVSAILKEAATHLESIGQALWPQDGLSADAIADDVRSGIYFIARMGGEAVGTLKYQLEDALVWPDIPPGSSAYVHRLAVRRKVAGTGVSSHMLNWAKLRTKSMGRKFLRLDCALRPKLCAIYENNGFTKHSERQVGPYHIARYECSVEDC